MARQVNFNGYLINIYGAYIRTNISSLVDVNGVSSGIVGVVGMSERGEVGVPVKVTSYVDLVNKFGDGPIVRHGLAMFIGGASELTVVRIGNPAKASLSATRIDPNNTGSRTYTISARERGTFGNYVSFAVYDDDLSGNDSKTSLGSKRLDDNRYRIVVRYTDKSGNDVPEEFHFPRYIPLPTKTKSATQSDGSTTTTTYGNFYNQNTDRYFLLRDRVTGNLREVPEVWTYGSEVADPTVPGALTTLEQFLGQVESLKYTSEDLLTFPTFLSGGTTRSPYPIAVIAQVINFGGFGYSQSQFVTLDDISPDVEDLLPDLFSTTHVGEIPLSYDQTEYLLVHGPVSLSGGTNGDDGTSFYVDKVGPDNIGFVPSLGGPADTDLLDLLATNARNEWVHGLAALQEEDVNFAQLAYLFNGRAHGKVGTTWAERYGFFKSVMPLLLAHINTQSNTPNRKFRTSIVGIPWFKSPDRANRDKDSDFLDETQEIAGLINNDRIQLWAGGFKSRAFSTQVENYGAEMLSSFIVGLQSGKEVQDSITFQQIAGIFTDGLEFNWSTPSKSQLYSRATDAIFRRRNSTGAIEYIAAHNLTSWTGASNRGIPLFITRRIVDYMNAYVYKNLEENFIGRKSEGAATENTLTKYVSALLNRLVQEGKLTAFANVKVSRPLGDPTIYEITFDFQPVSEIDFLLITGSLTYSLN